MTDTAVTSRPTALVVGSTGQLGWELVRQLSGIADVVATQRAPTSAGEYALDLLDEPRIAQCLRDVDPDIVINAAAYTQVDRAETDVDTAHAVNFRAAELLARGCASRDALLIHYSTDYVFDGEATEPYREDQPATPRNVYGQSKLAGENAIKDIHSEHFIFRTSWVYAARGKNFVRTIFERAQSVTSLRVVADQHGRPTSACALAAQTVRFLERVRVEGRHWASANAGTYHLAAQGSCSWHELAEQVVADLTPTVVVEPIPTSDFPTPAPRPAYSVLDCALAGRRLGLRMPHWKEQLKPVLEELRESL